MALSAEPDVLDPTTSSSLYTRYVMETMCEKLYDIDVSGEIVPMLATELPEVSDDGRTVLPLKEGVRFADGTPFDAEAVKTSIDRHLTKEDSSRRSELGPITDVKAVDEHTVEIDYETPFAPIAAVARRPRGHDHVAHRAREVGRRVRRAPRLRRRLQVCRARAPDVDHGRA